MINDPLLQNTVTQTTEKDAGTKPTQKRRKHPAISARILALGLSTTALIGMSAGYAAAEKKTDISTLLKKSTEAQPVVPTVPVAPAANSAAETTPQVVEIPMPSVAAPADPGNTVIQANPAYTQNSNGSN